jgi:hypothetical protein
MSREALTWPVLPPQVDSAAPWIGVAQDRNARRRENAGRMAELVPNAERIDAGAAGMAVDAANAAADASQRAVPGKLYTYSQDNEEVVLELPVPPETKAKDVSYSIKPDTIALAVATLPEAQREVLKGELFQARCAHACACASAEAAAATER